MKKHFILIVLFLFGFSFSQEKKIEFSKALTYETFAGKNTNNMRTVFHLLGNTNGEFLTSVEINSLQIHLFSAQLGMIPVKIGLESKLSGAAQSAYFFDGQVADPNKKKTDIIVKDLKSKENILGNSCNNYLLTYNYADDDYNDGASSSNGNIKICVDEKNSLNNIPVLTGIINQLGQMKISEPSLKGLVLKITPNVANDNEFIILKSVKDSKTFAYFNQREAMMEQQVYFDSLVIQRKKESMARNNAIDSTDSDSANEDFASDDIYDYIEKYESTYKKAPTEFNYAIDDLPSIKLWDALPNHCRNIDKDLPALNDEVFLSHLKNFTGQICDLYLVQNEYHNVAVKLTIDDIRREFLFLNEKKEKLNKADQKKVNKYLENLD